MSTSSDGANSNRVVLDADGRVARVLVPSTATVGIDGNFSKSAEMDVPTSGDTGTKNGFEVGVGPWAEEASSSLHLVATDISSGDACSDVASATPLTTDDAAGPPEHVGTRASSGEQAKTRREDEVVVAGSDSIPAVEGTAAALVPGGIATAEELQQLKESMPYCLFEANHVI